MATSIEITDSVTGNVGHISQNCSNCIETGSTKAARCFCHECDLALCGTCEGMHRKLAPFHEIENYNKDVSEVDKGQLAITCSVHRRQEAGVFCEDHDVLICSMCQEDGHCRCSVHSISEACDITDVSKEIFKTLDELMKTGNEVDKLRRVKQLKLAECNAQIEDRRQAITSLRRKFSIMFDRYETQLMSKGKIKLGYLASSARIVGNLSERLNSQIKLMEDNVEIIDKEESFKQLMIAKAKCKKLNDELAEVLREKTEPFDISIDEDKSLPILMDKLSELVHQEINDSDAVVVDFSDQPLKKSFLKIKSSTSIKETDPQLRSDKDVPDILGCCWLPDDNGLIVCDYESRNKTLKLFDKDMNVKFTATCSSDPYDVCLIDKTTAVVTLPTTKEIQFITLYPGFKFQEKKNLKLACYGVFSNGKNIFLCVYESSSVVGIQILTLEGDVQSFIPHLWPGFPRKLCLGPSGNIFCTGGYGKEVFINCFTKDGHGIYSVSSKHLHDPRGIICDTEGNVLVCDNEKKCVQVVSSTGVCGELVINDKDYRPKAMCINKSCNILAIAYRKSTSPFTSKLILYKLEYA